jgi:hypothetical protein
MTQPRDIERLLDQWFADGSSVAPDRIIDTVVDRIERQPQRPAWRLDWRHPLMNPLAKAGVAIAAVVLIAIVGFTLLPGASTSIGVPAPSASPTRSPQVFPSPSTATRILPEGELAAGTYSTQPFVGQAAGVTLSITVPNGWHGVPPWALTAPTDTEAPIGSGIAFLQTDGAFDDPCHWDTAGTGSIMQPIGKVVGPSVDALVADLRANQSYVSTAPTDIVVDGHAGKQMDIQLPSELSFASCDKVTGDETGTYNVLAPPTGMDGTLYAQGPGNVWHLRIFDVDGSRLIAVVADYALTPAEVKTQAQAIIDSIKISQ